MPKIYKATKRLDSIHVSFPLPGNVHNQRTIVLEQGINSVSTEDLAVLRAHPLWLAICQANGIKVEGEALVAEKFVTVAPSKEEKAMEKFIPEAKEEEVEELRKEAEEAPSEVKSERQIVVEELTALGVEFDEDASLKKLKTLLEKSKK